MASEKKTQILELDPPTEMVFTGPFNDVVTANLKLTNPTNDTVIFKVKTTAPKQYCVRPNSGMLHPHEDTSIAVMLQPFDPSSPESQKHKFMVQTMIAPSEFNMEQLDNVWKMATKADLMDSKLKCTFVTPPPAEQLPEEPTSPASEPAPAESGEVFNSMAPADSPKPESSDDRPLPSQPTAGSTPGPQKQDKNEAEKAKATTESKLRVLQEKVDKLSSENVQLKGEANKLKQRLVTAGSAAAGKIKPQITHSSSPLNLVAIMLILVAIILGYLVGKWL